MKDLPDPVSDNRGFVGSETPSFPGGVSEIRRRIKGIAGHVKLLKDSFGGPHPSEADVSEVMANLTLAYRHLEDASMRLGKVLQAYDGGVSVYDKDSVVGAK